MTQWKGKILGVKNAVGRLKRGNKMAIVKRLDLPKLKDKPGKGGLVIDCIKSFGYLPTKLVIQKVSGENNKIVIQAVNDNDTENRGDLTGKVNDIKP